MKLCIDPGASGALATQYDDGKVIVYDCPDTQRGVYELVSEIAQNARSEAISIKATLEAVHAFPGQGVCSVWSFAANYATWQMALIACGIPFDEVTPQTWQKKFGNLPKDKKERKHAIKDRVQKLFPDVKVTLKNADALAMLAV